MVRYGGCSGQLLSAVGRSVVRAQLGVDDADDSSKLNVPATTNANINACALMLRPSKVTGTEFTRTHGRTHFIQCTHHPTTRRRRQQRRQEKPPQSLRIDYACNEPMARSHKTRWRNSPQRCACNGSGVTRPAAFRGYECGFSVL